MSHEMTLDMSWNSTKDLELALHCIKSPVWNEGENGFYNKPFVRELLYKSGVPLERVQRVKLHPSIFRSGKLHPSVLSKPK